MDIGAAVESVLVSTLLDVAAKGAIAILTRGDRRPLKKDAMAKLSF